MVVFGHVCLCLSAYVCNALIFDSLVLESSVLACSYIFSACSYVKIRVTEARNAFAGGLPSLKRQSRFVAVLNLMPSIFKKALARWLSTHISQDQTLFRNLVSL